MPQTDPSFIAADTPPLKAEALGALLNLLQAAVLPANPEELLDDAGFNRVYTLLKELRLASEALASGAPGQAVQPQSIPAAALARLQHDLARLTSQVQQVAAGDLSQRVDFPGEVSIALNAIVMTLEATLADLRQTQENLNRLSEENSLLYQEAMKSSERFAVLWETSKSLSAANQQIEQIYAATHQGAAQLLPVDQIGVYLLDEDGNTVTEAYLADWNERYPGQTYRAEASFAGAVARQGRILMAGDLSLLSPGLPAPRHFGEIQPQSLLAVTNPMAEHGRVVVCCLAAAVNAYKAEDEVTLSLLAGQMSLSLESALLFADVQRLATIDPLTGLANRRHFFDQVNRELSRAQRYQRPMALIIADIDYFKQVNDRYGHPAGDRVLQRLAEVCKGALRAADLACRYGGEEFAFMLPETSLKTAGVVAERLRSKVSREVRIEVAPGAAGITVSLGVAAVDFAAGEAAGEAAVPLSEIIERLVKQADQALYTAKQHGRNQARTWQGD
jgi:diguanylate cyclase (GGDEF)-like protein